MDGCFSAFIVCEKGNTREEVRAKISDFEVIPEQHSITLLDFLRKSSFGAYICEGEVNTTILFKEAIGKMFPSGQTDSHQTCELLMGLN